jgi:hypothetical protein
MSSMQSSPSPAVPNSPASGAVGSRPLPPEGVDRKTGRAVPIPDPEWQRRCSALEDILAEIDAVDDTPEENYEVLMRNIDEERRREGRPPAFQGQY